MGENDKKLLDNIFFPEDLKKLEISDLPLLAGEIREYIIDITSIKEGHLGASLGVVDLAIALHYVFDAPKDKLVWDVGHQAYAHKILTGRKEIFNSNRQFNGLSGFPKISESQYDSFGVGHSSTSISAIMGMAVSSKLKGNLGAHHIAIIGDASIASGMAFEALNNASSCNCNILIILNDNSMSIDPNVGSLNNHLSYLKKSSSKNKNNNFFEALKLSYTGPISGHDIDELIVNLQNLKSMRGANILHIVTKKGKGYDLAEKDQVKWHSAGSFNKLTGEKKYSNKSIKYQDVFGLTLNELAHINKNIVAISPAMISGSSLNYMLDNFPDRVFDVGISEQHALTFSAGLAVNGHIPFCVVYSTFLQRAYDQVIHDIALQNLNVVICIDRAGLVGRDGATHHGYFDIAFMRSIPNFIVACPMDEIELRNIMFTAQKGIKSPIAIRYPRGYGANKNWKTMFKDVQIGKGRLITEGEGIAIISLGHIGNEVKLAVEELNKSSNKKIAHYDMVFAKPIDEDLLNHICSYFTKLITIEDGIVYSGFGIAVMEFINRRGYRNIKLKTMGIPDKFIDHGSVEELRADINMDKISIINAIKKM